MSERPLPAPKTRICPCCRGDVAMKTTHAGEVELDICPACRGVYFDRGELKKVITGALDAETVLTKSPSDSSHLVCPECEIEMDRVHARKGITSYELHFCRKCLATFLQGETILRIRKRLAESRYNPPSMMRPKASAGTLVRSPGVASEKAPSSRAASFRKVSFSDYSDMDERRALMHYSQMGYDRANEYETLSAVEYVFCMITNLPIEVYNPRVYFPFVLLALILVNAAIFIYCFDTISIASSHFHSAEVSSAREKIMAMFSRYGLIASEAFGAKWYFNLLSSQFFHASLGHFVFNMYFLWIFGDNVCDIFYDFKTPFFRELMFLLFYLYCGVAGGIAHSLALAGVAIPAVGASGAISGIIGAYIRLFPKAHFFQIFLLMPFKISAMTYFVIWMFFQIVLAYLLGSRYNVAWMAHLGGFIAGYAGIGFFIPYKVEEVGPRES